VSATEERRDEQERKEKEECEAGHGQPDSKGCASPLPPYAAVLARSTQSAWLSAMTAFL
jgi:hypothetical protein